MANTASNKEMGKVVQHKNEKQKNKKGKKVEHKLFKIAGVYGNLFRNKKDYRYCSRRECMCNSGRNPGIIYPPICRLVSINMRTVFSVFPRVPYLVEYLNILCSTVR
jgi:hypothetical protein